MKTMMTIAYNIVGETSLHAGGQTVCNAQLLSYLRSEKSIIYRWSTSSRKVQAMENFFALGLKISCQHFLIKSNLKRTTSFILLE